MTIFAQTMSKVIGDYRSLLRRHLNQVERMNKLQKLHLKESDTYASDFNLYKTGWAIVEDIETNIAIITGKKDGGYYFYSGIGQFCSHLKQYLNNYHLEGARVVHRAQKASRATLQVIQLVALPAERLTEMVHQQLMECCKIAATFGSREQCALLRQTLMENKANNPKFYTDIITYLEGLLSERFSEAA